MSTTFPSSRIMALEGYLQIGNSQRLLRNIQELEIGEDPPKQPKETEEGNSSAYIDLEALFSNPWWDDVQPQGRLLGVLGIGTNIDSKKFAEVRNVTPQWPPNSANKRNDGHPELSHPIDMGSGFGFSSKISGITKDLWVLWDMFAKMSPDVYESTFPILEKCIIDLATLIAKCGCLCTFAPDIYRIDGILRLDLHLLLVLVHAKAKFPTFPQNHCLDDLDSVLHSASCASWIRWCGYSKEPGLRDLRYLYIALDLLEEAMIHKISSTSAPADRHIPLDQRAEDMLRLGRLYRIAHHNSGLVNELHNATTWYRLGIKHLMEGNKIGEPSSESGGNGATEVAQIIRANYDLSRALDTLFDVNSEGPYLEEALHVACQAAYSTVSFNVSLLVEDEIRRVKLNYAYLRSKKSFLSRTSITGSGIPSQYGGSVQLQAPHTLHRAQRYRPPSTFAQVTQLVTDAPRSGTAVPARPAPIVLPLTGLWGKIATILDTQISSTCLAIDLGYLKGTDVASVLLGAICTIQLSFGYVSAAALSQIRFLIPFAPKSLQSLLHAQIYLHTLEQKDLDTVVHHCMSFGQILGSEGAVENLYVMITMFMEKSRSGPVDAKCIKKLAWAARILLLSDVDFESLSLEALEKNRVLERLHSQWVVSHPVPATELELLSRKLMSGLVEASESVSHSDVQKIPSLRKGRGIACLALNVLGKVYRGIQAFNIDDVDDHDENDAPQNRSTVSHAESLAAAMAKAQSLLDQGELKICHAWGTLINRISAYLKEPTVTAGQDALRSRQEPWELLSDLAVIIENESATHQEMILALEIWDMALRGRVVHQRFRNLVGLQFDHYELETQWKPWRQFMAEGLDQLAEWESAGKAVPPDRILSVLRCLKEGAISPGSPEFLDAIRLIIQALPSFYHPGSTLGGRMASGSQQLVKFLIQRSSDILSEPRLAGDQAASEALKMFEVARGTISSNIINYRPHDQLLAKSHPQLARELRELLERLDQGFSEPLRNLNPSESTALENILPTVLALGKRDSDVHRLEKVIQRIRHIRGFENFMSNEYEGDEAAMNAAKDSSIVYVSAWGRGHALIVTRTQIDFIWLDGLDSAQVSVNLKELESATNGNAVYEAKSPDELMKDFLEWLWNTVTKPVLQHLGMIMPQKMIRRNPRRQQKGPRGLEEISKLPRIWWIGVGHMSQVPFHAAGIYPPTNRDSAQYTAKYCISSYTVTIRALAYANLRASQDENQNDSENDNHRMLIVTMPKTPSTYNESVTPSATADASSQAMSSNEFQFPITRGMKFGDLNVAQEAQNLSSSCISKGVHCTLLESPDSGVVLCSLAYHNIVHFACHGVADSENPLNSCLVLQRPMDIINETNFVRDELKVANVLKVRPTEPCSRHRTRLVYLSACSTASNKCLEQSDEPLHLAGVFQLAGFDNVIGTLWESDDSVCTEVATRFYGYLFEIEQWNKNLEEQNSGERKMGCAEALHLAVESVRNNAYWRAPSCWAPFVHWGV